MEADEREIEFRPSRVLMHDTTCVPALVDHRDAPRCVRASAVIPPRSTRDSVDLIVDHSVMVEPLWVAQSAALNLARGIRAQFRALYIYQVGREKLIQFRVAPPGSGIILKSTWSIERRGPHRSKRNAATLYPDTLVGTTATTPMINALGIVAWGVGGSRDSPPRWASPVVLRILK